MTVTVKGLIELPDAGIREFAGKLSRLIAAIPENQKEIANNILTTQFDERVESDRWNLAKSLKDFHDIIKDIPGHDEMKTLLASRLTLFMNYAGIQSEGKWSDSLGNIDIDDLPPKQSAAIRKELDALKLSSPGKMISVRDYVNGEKIDKATLESSMRVSKKIALIDLEAEARFQLNNPKRYLKREIMDLATKIIAEKTAGLNLIRAFDNHGEPFFAYIVMKESDAAKLNKGDSFSVVPSNSIVLCCGHGHEVSNETEALALEEFKKLIKV